MHARACVHVFVLVSGIYLRVPAGGIIMDCGEGSYGQLLRAFGPEIDTISAVNYLNIY